MDASNSHSHLKLDLPSVNLRAEFKPLLSTVNISIELSRSLTSVSSRISVEPSKISLHSEVLNVEFKLESIMLKPGTCRGLRWITSNELQLTLEAEQILQPGGDADNHLGTKQFCQEQLVSRIIACQSRCYCMGCGAQIFVSNCQFKRVLPLPSENWADFADIWFCHNHSHNNGHDHGGQSDHRNGYTHEKLHEFKNRTATPRADDCLVSSLYMLVRCKHVKPCSVSHVVGKLICKRCGNFLGFVKPDTKNAEYFRDEDNPSNQTSGGDVYKIYFHAVCFREEFENTPLFKNALHQGMKSNAVAKSTNEQPVEEFMCHLLKDQSHRFTSFRFIIDSALQYDEQAGVVILLWLLDQDLSVFHFSSSKKSNISDSSTNSEQSVHRPGQPWKLMKLLYKVQFQSLSQEDNNQTPQVFKAWEKDNTVHGISLPYPLCKQLVALLIDSTKQLPISQRNLNGFHVGYLRSTS